MSKKYISKYKPGDLVRLNCEPRSLGIKNENTNPISDYPRDTVFVLGEKVENGYELSWNRCQIPGEPRISGDRWWIMDSQISHKEEFLTEVYRARTTKR